MEKPQIIAWYSARRNGEEVTIERRFGSRALVLLDDHEACMRDRQLREHELIRELESQKQVTEFYIKAYNELSQPIQESTGEKGVATLAYENYVEKFAAGLKRLRGGEWLMFLAGWQAHTRYGGK